MHLPSEETRGVVVGAACNDKAALPADPPKISVSRLSFHYGNVRVLEDISLPVYENRVTALIGHSGCGKSTFLRTLNRIHETSQETRVDGEILLDGENVLHMDVAKLRKRVGMVFQSCNPFPMSIFENAAYGLRIHGYSRFGSANRAALRDTVEQSLQRAGLWNEVKDRLKHHAYSLSLGQQQRLCIARALAINPEVLLLDEPCSALDP